MKKRYELIIGLALVLNLGYVSLAQTRRQAPVSREFDQVVTIEDPTERITALKELIKTNSGEEISAKAREELVRSWAQIGERELALNRIEQALDAFASAIKELPERFDDKFFEETVARIPFVISARGYREEAIKFARPLEARFKAEPTRLGAFGEFYLNAEAPGDAIRVLQIAVKIETSDVRLRRALAAAYRMSLRLDEAAKEFEQVAALDARDGRAYGELGNLARARGDYAEATRFYRSQARIPDSQSAALKGLALTLLASNKEEEAKAELDKVIAAKGPDEIRHDLHLQTQMAFYYLAHDKVDKAADAVVQALTIQPRYSWSRIAAAEVDVLAKRPFEAEKHLLSALRGSDFPTLRFTLGKLYLAVEDFDGALEQFNRTFSVTNQGKLKAKLGGVLDIEAETLNELLAPERQAAIFVATPPTTDGQFAISEALVRFDTRLRTPASRKPVPSSSQPRRGRTVGDDTIEGLATAFIDSQPGRRPFRMIYIARRLVEAGQALPFVVKLSEQIIDMAEVATEAEGSVLEFPNYDRGARFRLVRGRALDARGWALLQMNQNREATKALAESIVAYGGMPEGKAVIWRLATVREAVGEEKEALGLYLAAYEPPTEPGAIDVKRSLIEVLYKKVNGSLDGLDARLGVPPRPLPTVGAKAGAGGTGSADRNRVTRIITLPEPRSRTVTPVTPRTSSIKTTMSRSLVTVADRAPNPASVERPVSTAVAAGAGPADSNGASRIVTLPEPDSRTVTPVTPRTSSIKTTMSRSLVTVASRAPSPASVERPDPVEPPVSTERPRSVEATASLEAPVSLPSQDPPVELAYPVKRVNARLLRWPGGTPKDTAPLPSSIGGPAALLTFTPREDVRLPLKRVSTRLMRWSTAQPAEAAPAPSEIVVELNRSREVAKPTESARPRTVVSERPRTVESTPEPGVRPRRVGRP